MGRRRTLLRSLLLNKAMRAGWKMARKALLTAVLASRRHFDKEERVIFPLAEKVLKAKTLTDLGETWIARRNKTKPHRG